MNSDERMPANQGGLRDKVGQYEHGTGSLKKNWRSTGNLYGRQASGDGGLSYLAMNGSAGGELKRAFSRESSVDSEASSTPTFKSSQESFASKMSLFEAQDDPTTTTNTS